MGLEMKSYSCDQIYKIDANCKIFKIRIVESPNNNIEISWRNTTMRSLEIKESDGVLKIVDHAAIGIYGTLALINLKKDAQLLIKIPSNYKGKIVLQTKEESIHVSNITADTSIGISTSTGKILLENTSVKYVDIRGNAGKIEAFSLDATDSITITSKNGEIHCGLLGSEEDYTVSCMTKNRRCKQTGTTGSGAKKVTLNSELAMIQFQFQNGISISGAQNRYNRNDSFKDW